MSRTAQLPNKIVALLKTTHFLSVGQIIEKLEQTDSTYNKTSVYRALEKLELDNLICKESFGEREAFYELSRDHHDHAICTQCNTILSVKCYTPTKQIIPGFVANHHHTTVYGLCASCLEIR